MADIEGLRTFVTVVRSGSFAAAARLLDVTPAMVGRRILGLEQRYGARLIERTTRAQRLTETGEGFLAQAELVLDAVDELDSITRSLPGELEGRIRVAGPATLGASRLATLVAEFCEANPAVRVELVLADRRADLIAEGFDFAVRVGELQASSMIARRVGTYRVLVVASPAHLARHGTPVAPEDLARAQCILNLNMSPRNRWPFYGADGRTVVAEVHGGLQIDNGEALRAAVLAGAGIACLPVDLVGPDVASGMLVRLFPDWGTLELPINIVSPSRRPPRRVSALIDLLAAGIRASHPV